MQKRQSFVHNMNNFKKDHLGSLDEMMQERKMKEV